MTDHDEEQFAWGNAAFVGAWTLEDVVAFVKRVHEIVDEEQARAAGVER